MNPDVLLVLSDATLMTAYQQALADISVVVCNESEDALQHALDHQPAVIVIDHVAAGHDVLDIITATPETGHTRIIVLTPLVDAITKTRLRQLGASDVFVGSHATVPQVASRIRHHVKVNAKRTA